MAASYLQISATFFDELVKDGRMPKPLRINKLRRWDRGEVDLCVVELRDREEDKYDGLPEPKV
jgi:predicted DNA-binding transcriptional regulator AlpA